MKILVWEANNGNVMWDASTPEKEAAAFLAMFNTMLEQGDYECCEPEDDQIPFFEKAKAGDAKAAKAFLSLRTDYEYEGFRIEEVIDPLAVRRV